MQLKQARIKNYRSIKDASIGFASQTIILGGNGSGKSTVLRAIDRFFSASSSVELDDFYARDTSEPIEIELTFENLTLLQQEMFGSRVHNGQLTVTRVFDAAQKTGKYYGSVLRHEPFDRIRLLDAAIPKRAAYASIREESSLYASLPTIANAGQINEALANWEVEHPHLLTLGRDDGQFLGFTNVARGALQKAVAFVFIPAVREASADAVDQKNSVVGRLLELVVKSSLMRRADIVRWQQQTADEFQRLTSPENLPELERLAATLSINLQNFYLDSGVGLAWRPAPAFVLPLPSADVSLIDDGFASSVDRQGHGLQRAFILTLLHYLTRVTGEQTLAPEQVEGGGGRRSESELEARLATEMPSLILGIEEPELYQHPTKQRHFANVLSLLSEGHLPGAASNTQVVCCSHSPQFVRLHDFDQIRIARRSAVEDSRPKQCQLASASLADVAAKLEAAYRKPAGSYSAASLRPRLHILGTELAEGFFASCAVLVEGPSDKAALLATASLLGVNLEEHGIAVLVAAGKENLDRPAAIFLALGVPTYVLWDCDKAVASPQNEALRELSSGSETLVLPGTHVSATWACFEHKLEVTLKDELGSAAFEDALKIACAEFDVNPGPDAAKSPAVMSMCLRIAASEGCRSKTLEKIVRAICALRNVSLPEAV